MAIFPWYITKDRQKLLDALKKIPDCKDVSKTIETALLEYIQKHGSGNPFYPITKWAEDPTFKACPAFLEDPNLWLKWLVNCDDNTKNMVIQHFMKLKKTFDTAERMTPDRK